MQALVCGQGKMALGSRGCGQTGGVPGYVVGVMKEAMVVRQWW